MAYSDLIQDENITGEFLAVIKPARQVNDWTLFDTNIYKNTFTYGYVSKVEIDGVEQTLASSSSISSGQYYWDNDNQTLYIYSTNPSNDFIVVTYELYYATKGAHFPRIPTSAISATNIDVFYEPAITRSPSFKGTLTDSLIGYLPSERTSITLGNPDNELEKHLYDSSFKNKEILVYRWLGDLKTENVKNVINGNMDNFDYSSSQVKINVLDRIDIFTEEYRNAQNSFYAASEFSNLDPNFQGRPIRFVYGRSDNCLLVNLDYNATAPSVSNNRIWAVREGAQNTFTGTVSASPSSTTTRTYLDSVQGLSLEDSVWLDKATDEYRTITAINRSAPYYIEHAALSSGAATASDTVKRGTLGNLFVKQNEVKNPLFYNRDYTESVSNNVIVITLNASAEVNAGINTLDSTETVDGRIYGVKNTVTKGGSPFGSDSSNYNSLTNPAVIIFDLLKKVGVPEDEINLDSFDTLNTEIGQQEIGFSLPQESSSNFPKVKDILTKIFVSNLVQLYINTSGKWEVDFLKPLTTEDVTISSDEIIFNSIDFQVDYKDIASEVIVSYNYKESSQRNDRENAVSNTAKYLHKIKRQKEFNTVLINSSDAQTLANRLIAIYGDRKGTLTLRCKNRFFENFISDIVNVSLEKHVGFVYNEGTKNDRKYEIMEIDKTANNVKLTLNDQKGIEDNSGVF